MKKTRSLTLYLTALAISLWFVATLAQTALSTASPILLIAQKGTNLTVRPTGTAVTASDYSVESVPAGGALKIKSGSRNIELVADGMKGWRASLAADSAVTIEFNAALHSIEITSAATNAQEVLVGHGEGGLIKLAAGKSIRFEEMADRTYMLFSSAKLSGTDPDGQAFSIDKNGAPEIGGPSAKVRDSGMFTKGDRTTPLLRGKVTGNLGGGLSISFGTNAIALGAGQTNTIHFENGGQLDFYHAAGGAGLWITNRKGYFELSVDCDSGWSATLLTGQRGVLRWDCKKGQYGIENFGGAASPLFAKFGQGQVVAIGQGGKIAFAGTANGYAVTQISTGAGAAILSALNGASPVPLAVNSALASTTPAVKAQPASLTAPALSLKIDGTAQDNWKITHLDGQLVLSSEDLQTAQGMLTVGGVVVKQSAGGPISVQALDQSVRLVLGNLTGTWSATLFPSDGLTVRWDTARQWVEVGALPANRNPIEIFASGSVLSLPAASLVHLERFNDASYFLSASGGNVPVRLPDGSTRVLSSSVTPWSSQSASPYADVTVAGALGAGLLVQIPGRDSLTVTAGQNIPVQLANGSLLQIRYSAGGEQLEFLADKGLYNVRFTQGSDARTILQTGQAARFTWDNIHPGLVVQPTAGSLPVLIALNDGQSAQVAVGGRLELAGRAGVYVLNAAGANGAVQVTDLGSKQTAPLAPGTVTVLGSNPAVTANDSLGVTLNWSSVTGTIQAALAGGRTLEIPAGANQTLELEGGRRVQVRRGPGNSVSVELVSGGPVTIAATPVGGSSVDLSSGQSATFTLDSTPGLWTIGTGSRNGAPVRVQTGNNGTGGIALPPNSNLKLSVTANSQGTGPSVVSGLACQFQATSSNVWQILKANGQPVLTSDDLLNARGTLTVGGLVVKQSAGGPLVIQAVDQTVRLAFANLTGSWLATIPPADGLNLRWDVSRQWVEVGALAANRNSIDVFASGSLLSLPAASIAHLERFNDASYYLSASGGYVPVRLPDGSTKVLSSSVSPWSSQPASPYTEVSIAGSLGASLLVQIPGRESLTVTAGQNIPVQLANGSLLLIRYAAGGQLLELFADKGLYGVRFTQGSDARTILQTGQAARFTWDNTHPGLVVQPSAGTLPVLVALNDGQSAQVASGGRLELAGRGGVYVLNAAGGNGAVQVTDLASGQAITLTPGNVTVLGSNPAAAPTDSLGLTLNWSSVTGTIQASLAGGRTLEIPAGPNQTLDLEGGRRVQVRRGPGNSVSFELVSGAPVTIAATPIGGSSVDLSSGQSATFTLDSTPGLWTIGTGSRNGAPVRVQTGNNGTGGITLPPNSNLRISVNSATSGVTSPFTTAPSLVARIESTGANTWRVVMGNQVVATSADVTAAGGRVIRQGFVITSSANGTATLQPIQAPATIQVPGYSGMSAQIPIGGVVTFNMNTQLGVADLKNVLGAGNVWVQFATNGSLGLRPGVGVRMDHYKDDSYLITSSGRVFGTNANGAAFRLSTNLPPLAGGPVVSQRDAQGANHFKMLTPTTPVEISGDLGKMISVRVGTNTFAIAPGETNIVRMPNGSVLSLTQGKDAKGLRWSVEKGDFHYTIDGIPNFTAIGITGQSGEFSWNSLTHAVDTRNLTPPSVQQPLMVLLPNNAASIASGAMLQFTSLADNMFNTAAVGGSVQMVELRSGNETDLTQGNIQFVNGVPMKDGKVIVRNNAAQVSLTWDTGSPLELQSSGVREKLDPNSDRIINYGDDAKIAVRNAGRGEVVIEVLSGTFNFQMSAVNGMMLQVKEGETVTLSLDMKRGFFGVRTSGNNTFFVNVNSTSQGGMELPPDAVITFNLDKNGVPILAQNSPGVITRERAGDDPNPPTDRPKPDDSKPPRLLPPTAQLDTDRLNTPATSPF